MERESFPACELSRACIQDRLQPDKTYLIHYLYPERSTLRPKEPRLGRPVAQASPLHGVFRQPDTVFTIEVSSFSPSRDPTPSWPDCQLGLALDSPGLIGQYLKSTSHSSRTISRLTFRGYLSLERTSPEWE